MRSLRSTENTFHTHNRGFTLIEVLVASVILSSVFFAILKLIASNTYQTTKLEHSKTMDSLFLSSKTCLQSLGYSALSWVSWTQSLHFGTGNMGCFTGSYDQSLSFTGISLEQKNNGEITSTTFWNYFYVENNTGSLKVYNTISDGTEKKEYTFLLGQ